MALPSEAPQPAGRIEPCSAVSEDNEVFFFSGRPLETATRGPLGQEPLDDLWSFNATCPKVPIVYQPATVTPTDAEAQANMDAASALGGNTAAPAPVAGGFGPPPEDADSGNPNVKARPGE